VPRPYTLEDIERVARDHDWRDVGESHDLSHWLRDQLAELERLRRMSGPVEWGW